MEEEALNKVYKIAIDNESILQGYLKLGRDTNCILLAYYCDDILFYKKFFKVTKEILKVNIKSRKAIKKIKVELKNKGYNKVWSKGVFSIYGDLRTLAVEAGFGTWGKDGLIHNEKYGSNFLLTAIFFR